MVRRMRGCICLRLASYTNFTHYAYSRSSMPHTALQCHMLHCNATYRTAIPHTALQYHMLHCNATYRTAMPHTALQCHIPHCIVTSRTTMRHARCTLSAAPHTPSCIALCGMQMNSELCAMSFIGQIRGCCMSGTCLMDKHEYLQAVRHRR